MLHPIFKLARTRDEHMLVAVLLAMPGALSIEDGAASDLIAEHIRTFRHLPKYVDSYDEEECSTGQIPSLNLAVLP